jgi:hypothetical protein
MKVQTMGGLIGEMRAVARNEVSAPADAATPSAESVEAVIRLPTPGNRDLMPKPGRPSPTRSPSRHR